MFEATRVARERALAGEGPTLIEAVTMRMHGHAAHDDMKYVPEEQVEEWQAQGPDRPPGAPAGGARRRRRRAARRGQGEIEAAVEEALASPMPDPDDGRPTACSPTSRRCSRTATRPWSGFAEGAA